MEYVLLQLFQVMCEQFMSGNLHDSPLFCFVYTRWWWDVLCLVYTNEYFIITKFQDYVERLADFYFRKKKKIRPILEYFKSQSAL